MARQGITFEQVSATADALVGEGQQPTIKAVRDRLTTGSPNTIHEHLKRWREARPVAAVAAPELPQALTAAIAAEIERAAAQARGEIEGRLVQAQAETDELTAYGNQLEVERDELAEQVAALTSERDTLAGKAAQQAADLADAQQRIEREQQAAEAARVELAKAQLKAESQAETVKAQAAEIERLRAALDAEGKARVSAEQQAAVLAAKLEGMTDRATKAEARGEVIEKQAQQSAQELNSARVQVQAQQGALDAAAREIDSAKAAASEARAEAKKAGEAAAELRGRLAQQTADKGKKE
jgi:chromosome segregation ATPase